MELRFCFKSLAISAALLMLLTLSETAHGTSKNIKEQAEEIAREISTLKSKETAEEEAISEIIHSKKSQKHERAAENLNPQPMDDVPEAGMPQQYHIPDKGSHIDEWWIEPPEIEDEFQSYFDYTRPCTEFRPITNYSDINYKKHSDLPRNILKHSLMYFIHIPKTGGMTFWGMMRSAFKQKKAPFRFDTNFAFNSMAAKWLNDYHIFNSSMRQFDMLVGHHDASVIDAVYPRPVLTFTMMRDPVHRIVSWRYFVKSVFDRRGTWLRKQVQNGRPALPQQFPGRNFRPNPMNPGFPQNRQPRDAKPFTNMVANNIQKQMMNQQVFGVTAGFTAGMTFDDFVAHLKEAHIDNYAVRAFSGTLGRTFSGQVPGTKWRLQLSYPEMLLQAKRQILKLDFLGLTEFYEESIKMLDWLLGKNGKQKVTSRNITPPYEFPDKRVIEKIVHQEKWDIKLHAFAVEVFKYREKMYQKCYPEIFKNKVVFESFLKPRQ